MERQVLPTDGLPTTVRTFITEVCRIYHCPEEFVTASVLSIASTAVGRKMFVDEGRYRNSLALWFVLVARSGSNKSFPMKLTSAPLREIDAELNAEYRRKHKEWSDTPLKDRSDNEPRCPAIVVDDCTDERRSEILYMNNGDDSNSNSSASTRGAIGIYPELKGMFDAKNQYSSGGTAAISKLLRLFDNEDIKVDRKNGFTMLIKNPFFNILGDLQTDMLRPTFGNELFMTNGLNQRFLFCMAEDIEYPERSAAVVDPYILRQWERIVRTLYDGIFHDPFDSRIHRTIFRSADKTIRLSTEADQLYTQYYNALQQKKAGALSDYEASIYSKLQIQVLRLAGIVHALDLAEKEGMRKDFASLDGPTMEYAIRCMNYFEQQARKVHEKLVENRYTTEAERQQDVTAQFPADAIRIGEVIVALSRINPELSQYKIAEILKINQTQVCRVLKAYRIAS